MALLPVARFCAQHPSGAPAPDRGSSGGPRKLGTPAGWSPALAGTGRTMRYAWSFGASALPLVMTAIHAGHDLRPDIAARVAIDDDTRRREEDPFTDRITRAGGIPVVVHRSRFEVDLNRPRGTCVYVTPEQSWGSRRVARAAHRRPGRVLAASARRVLRDARRPPRRPRGTGTLRRPGRPLLQPSTRRGRRAARATGGQSRGQHRHRIARSTTAGVSVVDRFMETARPPGRGRPSTRRPRERPCSRAAT